MQCGVHSSKKFYTCNQVSNKESEQRNFTHLIRCQTKGEAIHNIKHVKKACMRLPKKRFIQIYLRNFHFYLYTKVIGIMEAGQIGPKPNRPRESFRSYSRSPRFPFAPGRFALISKKFYTFNQVSNKG
jgi:hypothetical protein